MLASDKDQDEFDEHPPEWHEHFLGALLHHTGHGEHPGQYDSTAALASQRLQEQGPAPEMAPGGPPPPQEGVQQPTPGKAKKPSAPPHGTTPVGVAQQVVQPEPPEGQF